MNQSGTFNFTTGYTGNNQFNTYSYDAAGNLRNDGMGHANTYDALGRLATMNGSAIYVYDGEDRRVGKNVSPVVNYFYFGGKVIAALTSGSTWTDYDLDSGLAAVAEEPNDAANTLPTYRAVDNLESLAGTFDSNGNFSAEMNYAPYGLAVSGSGTDRYQCTGLETDTETGLNHADARQYSPNLGRWMSPDPYAGSYDWANPQSLNRYTYVNGRPMSFVDPTGEFTAIFGPAGSDALCGPECMVIAGVVSSIFDLGEQLGWFSGAVFHGTLKPRAGIGGLADFDVSDGGFGEELGLPAGTGGTIPGTGGGNPSAISVESDLGLKDPGCEYGTCGMSFQSAGATYHGPADVAYNASFLIPLLGPVAAGGSVTYIPASHQLCCGGQGGVEVGKVFSAGVLYSNPGDMEKLQEGGVGIFL